MNAGQTITGLTALQADELACVVRGADYRHIRVPHVPVSRSVTDSQVFACAPRHLRGGPPAGGALG
ncbi:hypothetical protein A5789_17605 [Nocardia sp. 852002-51101_SCH5132738]|nr:hypothetical protein A5789_17605 [Nocardia sp. 852002-51101_SCH5132738]OBB39955.1 hypothetical protein A5748_33855 [Nocardia sp. 852002-51244_SCH5132740]OBF67126.1 hypothetical protein A9X06_05060 [Mycobacterium sp. 852002-51759_SCH5129042]